MKDFNALFKKYPFHLDNEQVKTFVKEIIDKSFEKTDNSTSAKILFECLEVTSLKSTDNEASIRSFVEKINLLTDKYPEIPLPAGICVYPQFIETVKNTLTEDIEISTVVGFPSSQTYTAVKIAETGLALSDGATEIDMVMPVGKFLNGEYNDIFEEIEEIKASCHGSKLKVILETGLLNSPENIFKASILALQAGADFIKTTTGKELPTTLNAVYTMCKALKAFETDDDNKERGLKIAGGIQTAQDAIMYLTIVKDIMGDDFLSPKTLRIGASKLANSLISNILKEEVTYF